MKTEELKTLKEMLGALATIMASYDWRFRVIVVVVTIVTSIFA